MEKIYVVPAKGLRVLDPARKPPSPLPPEGKEVERTTYWLRREREGDVTVFADALAAKPAARKAKE